MNIPVLYEDEWFLAADKPSGLLVIPTAKKEIRTLTSILNEDVKERGLKYRLHPCHRLDRETSGVIIYAKGKSLQKKMMQEFKHKRIRKEYIAFVHGYLPRKNGRISIPLEGSHAQTAYRVIDEKKDFSVVQVWPLTGRTNQIRLHFKALGHPLVGETKFAFRKDFSLKAKRLCLHSKYLEFINPVNKKTIKISSALPSELVKFLKNHP